MTTVFARMKGPDWEAAMGQLLSAITTHATKCSESFLIHVYLKRFVIGGYSNPFIQWIG